MPPIFIIGTSARVVDTPGLKIEELAGNVASKGQPAQDRISIAYVQAKAGTAEPWLTLQYDEWMAVRKGRVVVEFDGDLPAPGDGNASSSEKRRKTLSKLEATAGQTIFIERGTRFHPTFPEDTEYIPVCLPAFRPDRCLREDEGEEHSGIAAKLKVLHSSINSGCQKSEEKPEILYHMTPRADWEAAKTEGTAYYPRTFEVDGHYTHATGVPSRLVTTANHFYQDIPGDWVCLEFTRTSLKRSGIHVRYEEAMPVGDKPVGDGWGSWICPHVIGGIPVSVVDKEYVMKRDGTKFLSIDGLTT